MLVQKRTTKIKSTILLFFILIGLIISSLPNVKAATTIYVDATNTSGPWDGTLQKPYRYIQDAINAAQPGNIIVMAAGTYQEKLLIQKNLILLGESRDTTIIDGQKSGHVIYVQGSTEQTLSFEISSITIKNAGGLGYDCIALSYVATGSITDTILSNSDQSDGIQLDHCTDIVIANNQIKNNKGAGISLTLSTDNILTNNNIQDNQKGIYIYLSSNSNQIIGNTIKENTQYGIYIVQSSNNLVYSNDFDDNGQNAQDASINYWYYNNQGNYWDDYNEYDKDPTDGVGDRPYQIPGGSNQDIYPLGYFLESTPPQTGNQAPIAYKPTAYPNPSDYEDDVTFTGGGSDSDGYIVEYYWRSNIDGYLSNQATFTTSTLSVSTHTIYFKIRDNDGQWSAEKTASIAINSIDNNPPNANILYVKPTEITLGEPLYFNGEGIDTDGTITAYKWSSNIDGTLGTKKSFSITNLSAGTHTITFQVQDNKGVWSSSKTTKITVINNNGTTELTADTGGPYPHNSFKITFDASDSTGGTDFFWDFGDGSFGSGITTTHT
ncbi:MAG: right-handed parallel beta-helix repeat-containing protein, partial [Candidatus Thermoplasmatota archaeon]|nr:right-handed parallel beta-helix repeat-containing protein [Candidatus Thermoplasmatota archaeon]